MMKKALLVTAIAEAALALLLFLNPNGFGFYGHFVPFVVFIFVPPTNWHTLPFHAVMILINALFIFVAALGLLSLWHRSRRWFSGFCALVMLTFIIGMACSSYFTIRGSQAEPGSPEAKATKAQFDQYCFIASVWEDISCDVWQITGSPPRGVTAHLDLAATNGLAYAIPVGVIVLPLMILGLKLKRRTGQPTSAPYSESAPSASSETVT